MEQSCQDLLDQILNNQIEILSEQEKALLLKNRANVITSLITLFSKEVPFLIESEEIPNSTTLFWGLELTGFLQAREAFVYLQKLCHVPIDKLDNAFEYEFTTERLAILLAKTAHDQWPSLKTEIENTELDGLIRMSCLEALLFLTVNGQIPRQETSTYLKSLLQQAIDQDDESENEEFITDLVVLASAFWPGECMEEIRELFGLCLIDTNFISLLNVIQDHQNGMEFCIKNLQIRILSASPLEEEISEKIEFNEQEAKWWTSTFQRIYNEIDHTPIPPDRNSECFCGSKLKYKKCCFLNNTSSQLLLKEETISYKPIKLSGDFEALPPSEQEIILNFHPQIVSDPELALPQITSYIEKYPTIPALYNYSYATYKNLQKPRKAMKILRDSVERFPDYLFGRIEYAIYHLRKRMPDEAFKFLGNVTSLSQLYPERTVFHATEYKSFAYALSLYYLQKNDIKQSKMYLKLVQQLFPNCPEIDDIKNQMKDHLIALAKNSRETTAS